MSKFIPFAAFSRLAFGRLYLFRNEVMTLWRAFSHPATPFHLKAAMLFIAFYLVNPIDLIPDFIPFAGWLDDLVLVPLMVSWIVRLLPLEVTAKPIRATVRRRQ
jgi:uncharacterized membrane protein YkvA (DUF1232 family)